MKLTSCGLITIWPTKFLNVVKKKKMFQSSELEIGSAKYELSSWVRFDSSLSPLSHSKNQVGFYARVLLVNHSLLFKCNILYYKLKKRTPNL